MSLATKSATSSSTAAKIWRKVQGTAVDAITMKVEELQLIGNLSNAKLAPSLREVTRPVIVTRDGGVASIAEGGAKARPMSPAPQEISCSLVHLQKQIAIADLVLMVQQGSASDTGVVKQFKYQVKMAAQAFAEQVGDYFYGPSSGILATTDTDLAGATDTLTLTAGFNQSWITNAAYLANLFRDGEYIQLLNAGTAVSNAHAVIDAGGRSTSAGTLAITYSGSAPSDSTNGLQIVKANSLESTSNDYNKAFVGLLEALTATSVHSLSGSTYPAWAASYADTTGGRLDGTRLEKAIDAIEDASGESPNLVIWAKGVKRDVKAQYKAAVQFNDAYAIPMDGDVKHRGLKFFSSRKVPPTFCAIMHDSAVEKFFWKPDEVGSSSMSESDLLESEDYTIKVGRIDLVGNLVWNSRSKLGYFRSLTEQ
jgi:hypothetical protein